MTEKHIDKLLKEYETDKLLEEYCGHIIADISGVVTRRVAVQKFEGASLFEDSKIYVISEALFHELNEHAEDMARESILQEDETYYYQIVGDYRESKALKLALIGIDESFKEYLSATQFMEE